jgi:hypothetical protein
LVGLAGGDGVPLREDKGLEVLLSLSMISPLVSRVSGGVEVHFLFVVGVVTGGLRSRSEISLLLSIISALGLRFGVAAAPFWMVVEEAVALGWCGSLLALVCISFAADSKVLEDGLLMEFIVVVELA